MTNFEMVIDMNSNVEYLRNQIKQVKLAKRINYNRYHYPNDSLKENYYKKEFPLDEAVILIKDYDLSIFEFRYFCHRDYEAKYGVDYVGYLSKKDYYYFYEDIDRYEGDENWECIIHYDNREEISYLLDLYYTFLLQELGRLIGYYTSFDSTLLSLLHFSL